MGTGLSRRQFLISGAALGFGSRLRALSAQQGQAAGDSRDLALINGRIHTMDANNRVVSQALIRNGRFAAVGNNVSTR